MFGRDFLRMCGGYDRIFQPFPFSDDTLIAPSQFRLFPVENGHFESAMRAVPFKQVTSTYLSIRKAQRGQSGSGKAGFAPE